MPKKNKKVKNRAVKTKEIQTTLCENLIDVGKSNYKSWIYLKDKLNFKRDVEFVEYLLSVAEKYLCSKLIHYGDKRQKYSNDVEDKGGKPGGNCQDNKKMDEDNEMDDETEIEEDDDEEIEIINTDTVEENKLINCDILGSKNSKRKNISAQSTINTKEDKSFRGEKMKKIINENESEKTEKKCVLALDSCPYCDVKHIEESCPLRCAQLIIADQTSSYSSDQEDFATTTLPDCLELQDLENGGETKRVVARQDIKRFTQFGPLIGERIKEMEIADDCSMKHIWQVQDGVYLTTTSTLTSNWLRWIRPAPVRTDRNIVPIEKNGQLYFSTCSDITSGDELFYWAEMRGAWASKKMEKTNCGGCNLQFEHAMYYRMHCAVFHEASLSLTVRKYHCKVCGKAVLGKQNIMKHALLYHEGKGAYQCQFCSKYFLRLNYLEMHRNYGCSANPHRARPLCDYCGRKFCQPQKLKVHIKRMHSDLAEVLQEFQCRDCLKVLGSRAALQRHTKEVHRRPSGVSCAKCSKTFQNKSNLKIHMLTHSGVKPFKCQEERCSAAFTTKQCLQFHYKKVHGLTEDKFPRIERSVEYTFESYSGGNENQIGDTSSSSLSDCGGGGEEPRPPLLRGEETSVIEYHRSAPPPPPPQPPPAPQKTWTDIEVSTAYNSETVVEHEARRSPSPKPYDYTRPQSTSPPPPSIGPPPSGYVSPSRYESGGHYLTPLSPLRYRSDEEVAQNLTKYKYDDNRSAVYHELIPRYPLYEYAWDVLRPPPPAPPPPPTSSSSQSIDLTVGGHLVGPTIIHERPPSPQTNYQSAVFHVQHKSPVYHHFSGYY